MSLSHAAFKSAERRPGAVCAMRALIAALSTKDRTALWDALGDDSITAAAIARVLSDSGSRVSANTVARHRRGDCTCPERTP